MANDTLTRKAGAALATLAPFTYLYLRRWAAHIVSNGGKKNGYVQDPGSSKCHGQGTHSRVFFIFKPHGDRLALLLVVGAGLAVSALASLSPVIHRHPLPLYCAFVPYTTGCSDSYVSLAALALSLLDRAIIVPHLSGFPVASLIFLVASVVQIWMVGRLRAAHTALQQARRAQEASTLQLHAVANLAPVALLTLNHEGVCIVASGAGLASFSSDRSDLIGRSVGALLPGSDERAVRAHFLRALQGDAHSSRETVDGRIYAMRWAPLPDAAGAGAGGVMVVALDVSDQERARVEATRLTDLRNDFLSAVSHEMRTPLTVILGFTELLRSRWPDLTDARRRHGIEQIATAAERQRRLVLDLLLVGQIEAAEILLEIEPLDLAASLRQAITDLAGDFPGQEIRLLGSSGPQVLVDAQRFQDLLRHLLDNAAKHSPANAPIEVTWHLADACVAVHIRDHGPGIPESAREYLFTRFGRVPGSLSRAGRIGTGVGLYVSREMARAMGGDLVLRSTGAEGSTFELLLPVACMVCA